MPLHDWTRVDDGAFHYFHLSWIAQIGLALNNGLLPDGYSALGEQVAGGGNPDVLTLHEPGPDPRANGVYDPTHGGGIALLTARPATRIATQASHENYTRTQRRMVIRHVSGDRIVAIIEIVSAGNKASDYAYFTFLNKALAALYKGIHLLVLDLHPPTPRDPAGIHGGIWGELTGEPFEQPADADRTLAAYCAGPLKEAFVEPVAVGQVLRDMPLFLTDDGYIEVPLEATYTAAFAGMPKSHRARLA